MQNQQNRSVHQLQLPFANMLQADLRTVSSGIILNISNNPDAPLIIRLNDGQSFHCGGLSLLQHQSLIFQSSTGRAVDFYHYGFNLQGLPINPSFKKLVIIAIKGPSK